MIKLRETRSSRARFHASHLNFSPIKDQFDHKHPKMPRLKKIESRNGFLPRNRFSSFFRVLDVESGSLRIHHFAGPNQAQRLHNFADRSAFHLIKRHQRDFRLASIDSHCQIRSEFYGQLAIKHKRKHKSLQLPEVFLRGRTSLIVKRETKITTTKVFCSQKATQDALLDATKRFQRPNKTEVAELQLSVEGFQ